MKQYVKLLKGKRLQPDLPVGDQPLFSVVHSLCDQASIGFGGRIKALGM